MKKNLSLLIIFFATIMFANAQSVTLTFPNGGEHWISNTWSPHNITWESTDVSSFLIEFSDDGGYTWTTIENNYTEGTFYSWQTPDIVSSDCLIRVSDASNTATNDQSDNTFLISDQAIYYAEWNTSLGNFRVELRGDLVPTTVQNFINLSEKNFYDNLIFHRVIDGFMIQDGCPLGTGYGGPGYEFDDEFHPLLRHSHAGILSMANAGANTNGSQYFITVDETSWLDDAHAVFGRVVDGMDVVFEISEVDTDGSDKPLVDVDIYSVEIQTEQTELLLNYPSAGESILEGTPINIEWQSEFVADLKVEFSTDNGTTWQTITDSIPADVSQIEWIVPSQISDQCFVKITSLQNPDIYSINPTPFEIRLKPVKIDRIEFFQNVVANDENPQNLIMPNAPLRFKIRAINDYSESLTAVSATITSDNPDVQITTETVNFDEITSGNEQWSQTEFEVVLPENYPDPANINFTISVEDGNLIDEPWISEISIPMIEKGSFASMTDGESGNANGNGNGILENGETAEIYFVLKNNTDQTIYNLNGKFTSPYNYVNIWNEVEGVNGMVYDSLQYNNGNPISAGNIFVTPPAKFVLDYNRPEILETETLLQANGYIAGEAGENWDEAGIFAMWGVSWIFNQGYPTRILETENAFSVYPNPTSGKITIKFEQSFGDEKNISIFSILGKLVFEQRINSTEQNYTADLSNLPEGVYFLKVDSQTQKIIISN